MATAPTLVVAEVVVDNAAVAAPADNAVAVVKEALVDLVAEDREVPAEDKAVSVDREQVDKAANVVQVLEDKAVNVDREQVVLVDNVAQVPVDPVVEVLAAVEDPVDPEVVVNRFTLLLT